MTVHQIDVSEAIVIDLDRFAALQRSAGSDWTSIDDLVAALCDIERAWSQSRPDIVAARSKTIAETADCFGMRTFSAVARDLHALSTGNDTVALAAVIARSVRIGEASLAAVWDLQDLRL